MSDEPLRSSRFARTHRLHSQSAFLPFVLRRRTPLRVVPADVSVAPGTHLSLDGTSSLRSFQARNLQALRQCSPQVVACTSKDCYNIAIPSEYSELKCDAARKCKMYTKGTKHWEDAGIDVATATVPSATAGIDVDRSWA